MVLRVEAAGVCHSDVHIWDGHFDLGDGRKISLESRGVHLPFTMGHEIAGEIVALGPEASGVNIGDKVVAYPWIGCGECAVCKQGDELLCLAPRTLGTRRHGGYATHVIVPHPRYLLPHDGVPQALAATYTCSGITALSALKKAQDHVGPDDHLVIIGAGGVGGSAVHIAPAVIAGKSSSPISTRRSARTPARWAPSKRSTIPLPTPSSRSCRRPEAAPRPRSTLSARPRR